MLNTIGRILPSAREADNAGLLGMLNTIGRIHSNEKGHCGGRLLGMLNTIGRILRWFGITY